MTIILASVAVVFGLLLLALAVLGKLPMPRRSEWPELTDGARFGALIVAALLLALSWWLFNGRRFILDHEPESRNWGGGGRSEYGSTNRLEARADQAQETGAGPALEAATPEAATPEVVSAPAEPTPAAPAPVVTEAPPAPAPVGYATRAEALAALAPRPAPLPVAPLVPAQTAAAAATVPCEPAATAKPVPKAATATAKPRTTVSTRARRAVASNDAYCTRADGDVDVCEVQRRYGIVPASAASYGSYTSSSGSGLLLRNRLGPGQVREQLRVQVDGRTLASISLSPSRPSVSTRLRLPAGGNYRLSGYTEYDDGRRVPIRGEGWLDPSSGGYEVRYLDEFAGELFLEPEG